MGSGFKGLGFREKIRVSAFGLGADGVGFGPRGGCCMYGELKLCNLNSRAPQTEV